MDPSVRALLAQARALVPVGAQHDVVPWERLYVPQDVDGSRGTFRAPTATCTLSSLRYALCVAADSCSASQACTAPRSRCWQRSEPLAATRVFSEGEWSLPDGGRRVGIGPPVGSAGCTAAAVRAQFCIRDGPAHQRIGERHAGPDRGRRAWRSLAAPGWKRQQSHQSGAAAAGSRGARPVSDATRTADHAGRGGIRERH